jgi:hypothetical protein
VELELDLLLPPSRDFSVSATPAPARMIRTALLLALAVALASPTSVAANAGGRALTLLPTNSRHETSQRSTSAVLRVCNNVSVSHS